MRFGFVLILVNGAQIIIDKLCISLGASDLTLPAN